MQRASNSSELEVMRGERPLGLRQHVHRRRLTADDTVGVIKVIDPATEEAIGSVPEAGLKATRAAIAAARRAFDDGPWPRTSPRDRAKVLRRFAAILDERHNFLKKLVMAESGSVGFLADIIQVRGTIDIAEWIAEAMELAVRWTEVSPPAGVRPEWPGTLWSANRSVWWPRSPRSTSRFSSTL